jgi:protocatechuate 3,4-dioxygenase alpha subunit
MSKITTSQTIGPFSHEGWQWLEDLGSAVLPAAGTPVVTLSGIVYDGDGKPVDDAQIEAWLPDAAKAEAAATVPGFRRVATGPAGEFRLRLSLSAHPAGEPAAYVTVFARGLTRHQFTAVFLEDAPDLAASALLEQVPGARRPTLIARKTGDGEYRWDIWLQSDKETVFFDYV